MLEVRVLGGMEIVCDGRRVALPPSKKTRALLAYLALTGRAHTRARLAELLWDVADDRRGALRWSLSKLRKIVDEPGRARIETEGDVVSFARRDARIDLIEARRGLGAGLDRIPTSELECRVARFRGQLLEGLELADFHEFHVWCVTERERARRVHAELLGALVRRLEDRPVDALPHARTWVQIDPHSAEAAETFAGLCAALHPGHRRPTCDSADPARAPTRWPRALTTRSNRFSSSSSSRAGVWCRSHRRPRL